MNFERASLEVFISRLRWAGCALGLVEAFIANPAPISREVVLAATLLLALYNVPASFIRRLPEAWVEPVIFGCLVGDFLVTTTWLFMSANDRFDPSFEIYVLVGVETAVLYLWRGIVPFVCWFLVAYSLQSLERALLLREGFRPDLYLAQASLTVMLTLFVGAITRQSERRRLKAEDTAGEAARQAELSEALHVISGRIARTLKRDYLVDIVVKSLQELFPTRWHAVLITASDNREVAYVADDEGWQEFLTPNGPSFAGIEGPIVIQDLQTDNRAVEHLTGPTDLLLVYRSAALVPLRAHGELVGVLVSLDPEVGAFNEEHVRFLESLAYQTAMALENARLYEDVELMSLTDTTTALFNRRAFDMRLEEELVRARRYNLPLALMMLDVDHFKDYNDNYGHLAGDEILHQLGKVLEGEALRHVDLPFRFGGEEFAVILPHTSADEALALARRLCRRVASEDFPNSERQPGGRLTISAGVAAFPEHGETAPELVDHADLALYAAKHGGRNRAALYRPKLRQERDKAAAV